MAKSFSAQVKDWTAKAKRNFTFVHRAAVQKLYIEVVADTPILTGNARRSWMLSTTSMPQINTAGDTFDTAQDIGLSIAGLTAGTPVYIGGQAPYLPRLEFGFTGTDALGRSYSQPGRLFVTKNAERWQEFVDQAAREVGGVKALGPTPHP